MWSRPATPTLVILGALLAQRVAEMALSKTHLRATRIAGGEPLDGGEVPHARARQERLLYAVHTLFFVLPLVESSARGGVAPFHVPAWLWWVSIAVLLGAQAVRVATMRALGVMWRIPAQTFTTDHIVTGGPYTSVRHPNHAIVLLEFAIVPLLCGAPLAWLALNVVHAPLVLARVRTEERALARLGPYSQLMVGRGAFVPRFSKRGAANAAPSR